MSATGPTEELVDVEVSYGSQVHVQTMTRSEYEAQVAQGMSLVLVQPD